MLRRFMLLLGLLVVSPAWAETFAITGATIVDLHNFGKSNRDLRDGVVVVTDGKITAVGAASQVKIPAGATRVNARGEWLIPGLIDGFSAQLDQGFANANLAMGVTTISQTDDRDQRRGAYSPGNPQPNMRRLGTISGYNDSALKGDFDWSRVEREARRLSDAELRADIDAKAASGDAGVMLMYPLDDHQLQVAVDEAKRRGLFTIGELGHASYINAARAGVQTFIHTSRIELGLAPPDLHAAIAANPFRPANDPVTLRYQQFLANHDTTSAAFREYAAELARHRTAIMPTLAIATTYLPDTPNPWQSLVAPLIDPARIKHLPFDRATGRAPIPPAAPADYVASRVKRARKSLETMQAFHAAGVPMLTGSGAVAFGVLPGWGLHREMALLVQSGLTPREALAAATDNYPEVYGWRDVGRIAPGYRADLVLLKSDPTTTDIAAAQDIDVVFLGGRRLDRATLLAWRPAKSN